MKNISIPAMASASCNSTLDNQSEPQDPHGVWLSDFFLITLGSLASSNIWKPKNLQSS